MLCTDFFQHEPNGNLGQCLRKRIKSVLGHCNTIVLILLTNHVCHVSRRVLLVSRLDVSQGLNILTLGPVAGGDADASKAPFLWTQMEI